MENVRLISIYTNEIYEQQVQEVPKTATQSFHEMLEIDTPEKARRLTEAFRAAEERGPLKFHGKSILKELEEGEEHLRSNPL